MPHVSVGKGSDVVLNQFEQRRTGHRVPILYKKCACPHCKLKDELQPVENFNQSDYYSDGYRSWCKKCISEYNRAQREKKKQENSMFIGVSEPDKKLPKKSRSYLGKVFMSDAEIEKAIDLIRRGYKTPVVAKRFNVPRNSLKVLIKKYENENSSK